LLAEISNKLIERQGMTVLERFRQLGDRIVVGLATAPDGLKPEHERFFILGQFGYPIGMMGYIGFIIIFLFQGLWPLFVLNCLAICTVAWAKWRHGQGAFDFPARFVLLVLIPVHATVTTLYVGGLSAFWVEIIVSITVIQLVPTMRRSLRVALSFILLAYSIVLSASSLFMMPWTPLPVNTEILLIAANITTLAFVLIVTVTSFDIAVERAEAALKLEYSRAESLLLNILPLEIAARLKEHEEPLADSHDSVSVLFADLSGFTEISRKLTANQLVTLLNDLFSRFDKLSEAVGAEKIKTIGDAYMVATGLTGSVADHAEKIAELALGMQKAFAEFRRDNHVDLRLRIGVHSGSVIAGVIGKQKFSYDLWGNTVNIASRMESEGIPDQIQISSETRELLPSKFKTIPRGEIQIKGHRPRTTYLLGDQGWPFPA